MKALSSYGNNHEEFVRLQNGLYRNRIFFKTNLTSLNEIQKNGKSLRLWLLNIKSGKERIFHSIANGRDQGEVNIIGYNRFYDLTQKTMYSRLNVVEGSSTQLNRKCEETLKAMQNGNISTPTNSGLPNPELDDPNIGGVSNSAGANSSLAHQGL